MCAVAREAALQLLPQLAARNRQPGDEAAARAGSQGEHSEDVVMVVGSGHLDGAQCLPPASLSPAVESTKCSRATQQSV